MITRVTPPGIFERLLGDFFFLFWFLCLLILLTLLLLLWWIIWVLLFLLLRRLRNKVPCRDRVWTPKHHLTNPTNNSQLYWARVLGGRQISNLFHFLLFLSSFSFQHPSWAGYLYRNTTWSDCDSPSTPLLFLPSELCKQATINSTIEYLEREVSDLDKTFLSKLLRLELKFTVDR